MVKQWSIFLNSVFFVLGFSVIFSLVGVLLQSILSDVSYEAQIWLGRVGGLLIIFFGLYLLGLIRIPFLEREHKLHVKKRFRSSYITSFVFGAAFAVGWTPCVGAVLGAILSFAATNPSIAFFLLLAYSLGLGIPFLVVGLFTTQISVWLQKEHSWLKWVNMVFGVILILLGILVFTNQLSRIASLQFASDILIRFNQAGIGFSGEGVGIGIAFLAGLVSFLSPCILPLIPAFLAYLGSTVKREG
ncbi:MAG TPA: cytochrome c biogenesis protein CcdA [Candidatus Nanoarchaeia archaeon]|nr:cytochrome c biogenesis protein CcdA [Candidatus Nanoarchaeia archaeon]